jgi:hypothetical protein
MITQVTFAATRCSRSARIWLVVAPHAVTVAAVARRPWPCTRIQTLASFFEQSIPAHRGCITSITHHLNLMYRNLLLWRVFRGGRESNRILTLVLDGNIHGSRGQDAPSTPS